MAKLNVQDAVGGLGDYLRDQRRQAQMSLRQLAELSEVSNPYLSQIERGLRRPSAEVLQQIAKGLRISAESLYVRAGILDADDSGARMVEDAIALDPRLTERQKTALLDVYRSFVGTDEVADAELAETVTEANQEEK
jgi:transcriptional regulator with XRE-family HTH domain